MKITLPETFPFLFPCEQTRDHPAFKTTFARLFLGWSPKEGFHWAVFQTDLRMNCCGGTNSFAGQGVNRALLCLFPGVPLFLQTAGVHGAGTGCLQLLCQGDFPFGCSFVSNPELKTVRFSQCETRL